MVLVYFESGEKWGRARLPPVSEIMGPAAIRQLGTAASTRGLVPSMPGLFGHAKVAYSAREQEQEGTLNR